MRKRVILTLMEGSFEQGFPAILQISSDGTLTKTGIQISGKLHPAPHVLEQFQHWQLAYRQMVMPHSRIKAKPAQVTNISCCQLGSDLVKSLNNWLNLASWEWQKIRDGLQRSLSDTDEIEFIVQTNDRELRQLPWHLWDFFEHYRLAEVALSAPEYQKPKKSFSKNSDNKVRILAILGNSEGIDVGKDRAFLEELSDQAQTKFLVEPQQEELNDQLWEKGWDILFFAGHSSSQQTGQILLNQTDAITLNQLRHALTKAIERGLRLAIFNSCEGLGLAQQLSDLHIGQVIVMREPVTDVVAQEFFRHFLATFSGGQSLYAAVREARERLQGLEGKHPYASWLPVICQNPAELPPTWQELCGDKCNSANTAKKHKRQILPKRHIQTVLAASVVASTLVMGVRHLGMLQSWELHAFDHLMQLRPHEGPDPRLLVVTISENDFQLPEQQQRIGSLSDLAMTRLLEKLEQYKPRAIGLDIYRDHLVGHNHANLATRMQSDDGFFAICKVRDREASDPGIAPPSNVPIERQGFSDVVKDSDGILRRHLLAMKPEPSSPCTTPYALSAQLAFHYLKETEGISAKYTQTGDLQLGNVVFKRLQERMGGYQKADTWGYQILLNYRSHRSPVEIAPTVTLAEVLNGKVKPEEVKDRIILIGVTAQSTNDYILTPYTTAQGFYQEIPGAIIQAQMVSQILSAVQDGRPLLSVLPFWGETLWIWTWSVVGVVLVWRCRTRLHLFLLEGAALGTLYILCLGLFTCGSWVPLVPSALALVVTGSTVVAYSRFQAQREQHT